MMYPSRKKTFVPWTSCLVPCATMRILTISQSSPAPPIMYDLGCMLVESRPFVVLDGLPGLYGLKYDSATACGLLLYLCSYKLDGSATLPSMPIPTVLHHLATQSNARCKHQKYYLFATSEQVYCNIRTRRLQHQNKATTMRDARLEKKD